MDTIKSEKIEAIKKYKRNQLLKNIFLYSFTALACLFYSSPFWFPFISSSIETVFIVHIVPKLSSVFFNTKFVFIVGNIIIVALITADSKVFSSNNHSCTTPSHESSNNYYDEYISTRQNLHKYSSLPNNIDHHEDQVKTSRCIIRVSHEYSKAEKHLGNIKVEKRVVGMLVKKSEGFIINRSCNINNSDEVFLPTEELKKRADDFIARINKRRVFEAAL